MWDRLSACFTNKQAGRLHHFGQIQPDFAAIGPLALRNDVCGCGGVGCGKSENWTGRVDRSHPWQPFTGSIESGAIGTVIPSEVEGSVRSPIRHEIPSFDFAQDKLDGNRKGRLHLSFRAKSRNLGRRPFRETLCITAFRRDPSTSLGMTIGTDRPFSDRL